MSKAQAAIKNAEKDKVNPHFRSKYADLTSIWDACREALTKNGLSVIQIPSTHSDDKAFYISVETVLLHESGQFIGGTLSIPIKEPTAQSVGSALTYARRYGLASIVGVAPDDDDGEAAQQTTTRPSYPSPTASQKAKPTAKAVDLTRKVRASDIWKWAQTHGLDDKDKFVQFVSRVLGEPKPSDEWTDSDMVKLESALANEEQKDIKF